MSTITMTRPPAWTVLATALIQRRPVLAVYHGHQRLLCPHALGWKHGRAKVLAYQADGTTSNGALPPDPRQRWRSLYLDDLHQLLISDQPWQTADNYTPHHNGIDQLEIAIRPSCDEAVK